MSKLLKMVWIYTLRYHLKKLESLSILANYFLSAPRSNGCRVFNLCCFRPAWAHF